MKGSVLLARKLPQEEARQHSYMKKKKKKKVGQPLLKYSIFTFY